jgi:hypothetical protein
MFREDAPTAALQRHAGREQWDLLATQADIG